MSSLRLTILIAAKEPSRPPRQPDARCYAVRPQEFESGKAVADFIEHERGSLTILDATQRQTLRVDQCMNFAPIHFLARAISHASFLVAN
jgi:hypothetical protein